MSYRILKGKKSIQGFQQTLSSTIWPEFMQHDTVVNIYWQNLYENFIDFQFALLDDEEIIGIGNTIPLNWQKSFPELPELGLDWALEKANIDFNKNNLKPNVLIGVQILINKKYQGKGISNEMLDIMKDLAIEKNLNSLALPVRPTLKHQYPLIPINEYIKWQRDDGLPFDPWIRVHIKSGGEITGICNRSMVISGTVTNWKKWTGKEFPGNGDYIIDGALNPVKIDIKENTGEYVEPNVWIIHKLAG